MTQHAELILVLGGARSGKSRYAEQLAARLGPRVLYLATAEAGDAEMAARIAAHQQRRPATWATLEAPLDPVAALQQSGQGYAAVLLDCLSLWVSNLLLAAGDDADTSPDAAERIEEGILARVTALLAWQRQAGQPLIAVSNEVGQGVVPATALGRRYRDVLGRVNQQVAAAADRVYYLVAGLALDLKALGAVPLAGLDADATPRDG